MKKFSQLQIIGKRWFDTVNGNSYHTVSVYIDCKHVFTSDRRYGGESMYVETASVWLDGNEYIKRKRHENGSREPLWQIAERCKFKVLDLVFDVPRRKDL